MLKSYPCESIWSKDSRVSCQITVCLSLYCCQGDIVEVLQSVCQQTQSSLDLVVVGDSSTDDALHVAKAWIIDHAHRFNRIKFVQHQKNTSLSAARNTAVSLSETPYVFILDADTLLYPRCLERCLEALEADTQAVMAYPIIEKLGENTGESLGLMGNVVWSIDQFKRENGIDAASLLRKDVLMAVGGYLELSVPDKVSGKPGWDEYELWCRLMEKGFYGIPISEILARCRLYERYRLKDTRLKNARDQIARTNQLVHEMIELHPWLELASGPL